jgi:hypothetical protein
VARHVSAVLYAVYYHEGGVGREHVYAESGEEYEFEYGIHSAGTTAALFSVTGEYLLGRGMARLFGSGVPVLVLSFGVTTEAQLWLRR